MDEVDTRGEYLVAEKVEDFVRELQEARDREDKLREAVDSQVQTGKIRLDPVAVLALSTHLLPELNTGDKIEEYQESRRTERVRQMYELLGTIRTWL